MVGGDRSAPRFRNVLEADDVDAPVKSASTQRASARTRPYPIPTEWIFTQRPLTRQDIDTQQNRHNPYTFQSVGPLTVPEQRVCSPERKGDF